MSYEKFIPKKIILHHSANASLSPQFSSINDYHRQKFGMESSLGFWGGYNYLIERDGIVRQYRCPDEVGAHTKGQNSLAVGICLAGNFNFQKPTANQIVSLCKLFDFLLKIYQIPVNQIFPHRFYSITDCPGLLLPDDWAITQFKDYLTENLTHLLLLLKAYLEQAINAILNK
jgi:hypothetical protein